MVLKTLIRITKATVISSESALFARWQCILVGDLCCHGVDVFTVFDAIFGGVLCVVSEGRTPIRCRRLMSRSSRFWRRWSRIGLRSSTLPPLLVHVRQRASRRPLRFVLVLAHRAMLMTITVRRRSTLTVTMSMMTISTSVVVIRDRHRLLVGLPVIYLYAYSILSIVLKVIVTMIA